jgi:hypothetical protein
LRRLVGVLAALLAVAGAVLAASHGGEEQASEPRSVDGVITQVASSWFGLQPASGGAIQRVAVRPADAPEIDLPHLLQHMHDRVPVRVFVQDERGTAYATEVVDMPPDG